MRFRLPRSRTNFSPMRENEAVIEEARYGHLPHWWFKISTSLSIQEAIDANLITERDRDLAKRILREGEDARSMGPSQDPSITQAIVAGSLSLGAHLGIDYTTFQHLYNGITLFQSNPGMRQSLAAELRAYINRVILAPAPESIDLGRLIFPNAIKPSYIVTIPDLIDNDRKIEY